MFHEYGLRSAARSAAAAFMPATSFSLNLSLPLFRQNQRMGLVIMALA